MITEEEYNAALQIVEAYKQQELEKGWGHIIAKFPKTIDELDLSVRAKNILRTEIAYSKGKPHYYLHSVFEWENDVADAIPAISKTSLLKTRNCGQKTVDEIENVFLKYGYQIPDAL